MIGELQGLCGSRIIKWGGTIVRSEGELDLVSPSLIVHGTIPIILIMSERRMNKEMKGRTDTLKPRSGWALRTPVNFPFFASHDPLSRAMELPKPPIVSPVESLKAAGMNPNPTRP